MATRNSLMNSADQIAAINRKCADEHRRVDLEHDRLIRRVQSRCDHERDIALVPGFGFREVDCCMRCGASMAANGG